MLSVVLSVLLSAFVASYLAWKLLGALMSRRWQLMDALLGTSVYNLLSPAFEGKPIGMVTVQPDVFVGGGSDDEDDHDHDHGHDHGPRNVVVVGQRWALVTGASRGIGRAFVRALSDHGFSLICLDVDGAELQRVKEETARRLERGWRGGVWRKTEECPQVLTIGCDVSDVSAAVGRCTEVVASLPEGSLRLLVNNVGVSTGAPTLLAQHEAADIERLVHVNTHFGMQLTRAIWPNLVAGCAAATEDDRERRSGVLFVSSAASLIPAAYAPVYAATKAAVNAFARALRAEAQGLRLPLDVLAITPGYVRAGNTPRWVGDSGDVKQWLAEPDEVVRAALLLLSTARASTITPLVSDAIVDAIVGICVPERLLARLVYGRLAAQRARMATSGASVSAAPLEGASAGPRRPKDE